MRRLTATFDGDFHLGFGLFTLVKGSSFVFDQKLVNNELWLPVSAHVHIVAKAIGMFGYRGEMQMEDSNFQRFPCGRGTADGHWSGQAACALEHEVQEK